MVIFNSYVSLPEGKYGCFRSPLKSHPAFGEQRTRAGHLLGPRNSIGRRGEAQKSAVGCFMGFNGNTYIYILY